MRSGTSGSSRWLREFENTMCPARAYCSSSSPAMEASIEEKRIGDFSESPGPFTLSLAAAAGTLVVSFHRPPRASVYDFPALWSEARTSAT